MPDTGRTPRGARARPSRAGTRRSRRPPLGNPRDGFDVQRMHGEERRDDDAPPARARQLKEQQTQQSSTCRVQRETDDMRGPRRHPEHRHVEHVRQPRDRPARERVRVRRREHPTRRREAQPWLDVRVVDDEIDVVERDEVVMADGQKDGDREHGDRRQDPRPRSSRRTAGGGAWSRHARLPRRKRAADGGPSMACHPPAKSVSR